jgi:aarF domain-containing kinase
MENAGPAFIKWGQWGSTRYDLLPPSLTDQLAKLTNSAPTHKFDITKELIREAFDCDISDLFVEFNPVPVASGSIAQIYKARLHPKYRPKDGPGSGTDSDSGYVAIKVRHPNTIQRIEIDFSLIRALALLFEYHPRFKSFRILDTIEQFNLHMYVVQYVCTKQD